MDLENHASKEQRDVKEKVGRSQSGKKVSYYYDAEVGHHSFGLGHPMKPHRMRMTHNLVTNYGLLDKMDVFRPVRATTDQMTRFHTDEYINFLERVTPETVEALTGSGTRFLTGEDCPAWEGLFEFCSISAGGSIGAAERLNAGAADTCINWSGGLHHAKKREASGFCYVNDIVLAILEFLRFHPRVLYIDIDVHHGDGVEEAFYSTDRVMTASFHKYGDFFPGTGDVRDTGIAKGKNYAVNVPLRDGITDETYRSIFQPVISHIMEWYRPEAVVLQCGADSLSGDKLGVFNLSMKGHAECVEFVSKFNLPMLVVGGGGYTTKNVSRTWTYETGLLLGQDLDENLPFNDYMEYFGPRFKLEVLANNQDNQNSREYLENIKTRVIDSLRHLPFAPSVGMHEVPRTSVGKAIGILGAEDSDDGSEIDVRINQRLQQLNAFPSRSEERDFDSDDGASSSRLDTDDDDGFPSSHRSNAHFSTGIRNGNSSSSSSRPRPRKPFADPTRPLLQPFLHSTAHHPSGLPSSHPYSSPLFTNPRPSSNSHHSTQNGIDSILLAKAPGPPLKRPQGFQPKVKKIKRSFFGAAAGTTGGGGSGSGRYGGQGFGHVVGGLYEDGSPRGSGDEGGSEVGGNGNGNGGWGAWKALAVEKGLGGGGGGGGGV
ncbi:hypothetical protein BDY24DRAFT_443623 [Mrakia frigida]|uniref:uncharacterized protein n=1 Tax=Mrakia frigida TaxID=29902 RepID=UPI003FCC05BA